jgi:hypothetical protein
MSDSADFPIAQRVFLMFSGLLFGGLATVGFLVTPTLFHVLDDKQVAGMIAGEIFKNASFFCLIISVFLLIYANLLVKRGALHYRRIRWFLLICIVLTLIGTFIIQPMMVEWRDLALNNGAPVMQSPYAKRFGLFHHISSVMFTIEVVLNLWVFWTAAKTR